MAKQTVSNNHVWVFMTKHIVNNEMGRLQSPSSDICAMRAVENGEKS